MTETAPTDVEPEDVSPSGDTEPSVSPDTDEPETFDREYVQKLRDEAAGHRVKAKRADTLAARLATAYAAGTGRLADPTDLPFTEELLDDDGLVDEGKVSAAVDELITRKPHLARRRPSGDVGQGARPETDDVGLGALLRRGA